MVHSHSLPLHSGICCVDDFSIDCVLIALNSEDDGEKERKADGWKEIEERMEFICDVTNVATDFIQWNKIAIQVFCLSVHSTIKFFVNNHI